MSIKLLFRTKAIDHESSDLKKCLSAFDLTLLGIGAIIGAGIFILTGIVAATTAGPGIIFSFVLAGIASACTALSYAELASSIGGCGSAYSYSYAGFGEIIAWIIGWDLLLEYGISCPIVAIGWSSYANNLLNGFNITLIPSILKGPFEGGLINLPAPIVILIVTSMLALGIKQSAIFNRWMVIIKLFVIFFFIVIASQHFSLVNWKPFLPFGYRGVIEGAAIIFFAYIGFDALSTTTEEAINPQRDLPIGILASLIICTLIYITVSGLLTGMIPYSKLNVSSPVAQSLLDYHYQSAALIVAVGAVAGLTTVILVMYYGFTRIFLAMARDGLLPQFFVVINKKTKTPLRIVLISGVIMMVIAAFLPIHAATELVNIGTLSAFILVCSGVIILRYRYPDIPRPFKTPLSPFIPLMGIILSIYIMTGLSGVTWTRFFIWLLLGMFIYFGYSKKRSHLAKDSKI